MAGPLDSLRASHLFLNVELLDSAAVLRLLQSFDSLLLELSKTLLLLELHAAVRISLPFQKFVLSHLSDFIVISRYLRHFLIFQLRHSTGFLVLIVLPLLKLGKLLVFNLLFPLEFIPRLLDQLFFLELGLGDLRFFLDPFLLNFNVFLVPLKFE